MLVFEYWWLTVGGAGPLCVVCRVKFGAAGVIDVLEASSKESIGELQVRQLPCGWGFWLLCALCDVDLVLDRPACIQRADVLKLGNLLLSLACRSPAAPQSRTSRARVCVCGGSVRVVVCVVV